MATGTKRLDSWIDIHGARTHNLKNISLRIPQNKLVVITGRSGSGKSSLAFSTLFAEGQRQYVESLSLYSRQFFNQIPRADVDLIEGLQPTLCLNQHQGNANRRSTVGTVTEVYDFLRVLFARVGKVHCCECGEPIQQQTPQQIREWVLRLPEGTKVMLLSPIVIGKTGKHEEVFAKIRRERLVRVRVDGELSDIDRLPEIAPQATHHIEAVVDRIIVRDGIETRILEAIELATRLSDGLLLAVFRSVDSESGAQWQEKLFSTQYACPNCEISYAEIQPRTFSFNSPYGACSKCDGLGSLEQFDPDLVLGDSSLSVGKKSIAPWKSLTASQYRKRIAALIPVLDQLSLTIETPLKQFTDQQRSVFLNQESKTAPGLMVCLEKELATSTDERRFAELMMFRQQTICAQCNGSRLCIQANTVLFAGKTIGEIGQMSLNQVAGFFGASELEGNELAIANPLLVEIRKRVAFLNRVGVGYVTLGRSANTLSGGELQRIRLATSIGNGLTSVCYVLDEPSIGLHPRDNQLLLETIRELQQSGNTVVVVEHDEAMMQAADYLIDIGPEAGLGGGEVVATGSLSNIVDCQASLTGQYLSGQRTIATPASRRSARQGRYLTLKGARGFNLQGVDISIPLGTLTAITGVSGSGKSTLINKTLYPILARGLDLLAPEPAAYDSIEGEQFVDKLVRVDQQPIGRTSRGCAATYTGIMDSIRKLFAATGLAKQRGFGATRFSFNDKSGACPKCNGLGTIQLKMNFLPDLEIECDACRGRRFNDLTLQVRFRGHSIAGFLRMSVDEARVEFENIEHIHRVLQCLSDVGLGYLPLGQSATTLSGGEAQRIKLATELAKRNSGNTLYLLDEPTTGLHFEDIRGLVSVLNQLVELGNTVIVIEHNLDLIRVADWVIDLGPEGGERGGRLVAEGTPEQIANVSGSATGQFLQKSI